MCQHCDPLAVSCLSFFLVMKGATHCAWFTLAAASRSEWALASLLVPTVFNLFVKVQQCGKARGRGAVLLKSPSLESRGRNCRGGLETGYPSSHQEQALLGQAPPPRDTGHRQGVAQKAYTSGFPYSSIRPLVHSPEQVGVHAHVSWKEGYLGVHECILEPVNCE